MKLLFYRLISQSVQACECQLKSKTIRAFCAGLKGLHVNFAIFWRARAVQARLGQFGRPRGRAFIHNCY